MSSRFQASMEWILENLPDLITILVAAVLVVRYLVRPPASADIAEILTWILAVLALLALSALWERNRRLNRIEKLSAEGRDLALRFLGGRTRASDFFLLERRLSVKELSSANKVYFAGKVLARTSREFMYVLGQRLAAGASVRFIILDPECEPVLQQAVLQSLDAPADFWRDTLRTTETVVEALAKTPDSKGSVEIGHLPYIPSFGLSLIDPDQPHGTCFVEVYQHKSAEPHPTFEVRASDDPYWFKFFKEQFDKMWETSNPRTVNQPAGTPSSTAKV